MTNQSTGVSLKNSVRTSVCAVAMAATLAMPAAANNTTGQDTGQVVLAQQVEQDGASQRINLSGKLRMLSQRVTAAACYTQSGIDSEASADVLNAATKEFEDIIAGLEFGDENLGIFGAEERRKTLFGLGKLNEIWMPVNGLAHAVGDGNGSMDDVTSMAEQAAPLLEMAQTLVTEISGQYSNPAEIIQANAMRIDIAGRQRMLAQRMSKNVCLISAGINVEAATEELRGAAEIFETSLMALRNGMAAAGIQPPPNDEISDQLGEVAAIWGEVKPIVTMTLNGQMPDAEQLSLMFHRANALTGAMNTAVGMYSADSKQAT